MNAQELVEPWVHNLHHHAIQGITLKLREFNIVHHVQMGAIKTIRLEEYGVNYVQRDINAKNYLIVQNFHQLKKFVLRESISLIWVKEAVRHVAQVLILINKDNFTAKFADLDIIAQLLKNYIVYLDLTHFGQNKINVIHVMQEHIKTK